MLISGVSGGLLIYTIVQARNLANSSIEVINRRQLLSIDCHKGIAHQLPAEYDPAEDVDAAEG